MFQFNPICPSAWFLFVFPVTVVMFLQNERRMKGCTSFSPMTNSIMRRQANLQEPKSAASGKMKHVHARGSGLETTDGTFWSTKRGTQEIWAFRFLLRCFKLVQVPQNVWNVLTERWVVLSQEGVWTSCCRISVLRFPHIILWKNTANCFC